MAYTPAEIGEGQFRVLYLFPGDKEVQVEVSIEDLNTETPYDALSWEWGRGDHIGELITIRRKTDTGHPHPFSIIGVRPNLLWALKRMRRPGNDKINDVVRLWVDFICINQYNEKEKSHQVAMMTDIYKRAETVHVWLGEPGYPVNPGGRDDFTEQELEIAFQHIDLLCDLDDANHIGSVDVGIRNKATLHNLEPLFKLLKRGWFSRRWVVQEVGVAHDKATVHCGKKTVSWEKLAHAVALLERIGRDGSIDRLFKLRPDTGHVSEYVGNISALPAYRLVQNISGLYRQLSGTSRFEQYTIEQLVCFLVISECGEPKDVIYSLLGIASDVKPSSVDHPKLPEEYEPFKVDYAADTTVLKVYTDFLKHAITKSKSLDILCRPWAPANLSFTLPSWILSAKRKPFRRDGKGRMLRYNPDPFVGPAVSRGRFYTASGYHPEGRIFDVDENEDKIPIAKVRGFKLADIAKIWDLAIQGNIPASWLRATKWENPKTPPPEELWRTLIADRTSSGLDPEPGYSSIIQFAAREKGIEYGINTNELLHEKDNSAYYEVFRRVQAVVWNRKTMRAKLEEDVTSRLPARWHNIGEPLGLVPAETEKEDIIYIVIGCSVPLVLRKKDDTEDNTYRVVGECYINNLMDGLAMYGLAMEKSGEWSHDIIIE